LMDMVDEIIAEEWRFTMKQLAVNGNILMTELHIPAWPELGTLLRKSYERVLEDISRNDKKTLIDMTRQRMEQ
jgi:hypothetical protein